MPLHKYPPKIWDALKLKQGIYSRLPKHYLKSLETKEPTPVHWKPLGVQYRVNPATGQKERVQDIPIPIHYPPQSQDGLWGGEGWISGYRYANNDKVSLREDVSVFCLQSELLTVNRLWYKMSVKRLCSHWFVFYLFDLHISLCSCQLVSRRPGSHSCSRENCTARSSTTSSPSQSLHARWISLMPHTDSTFTFFR